MSKPSTPKKFTSAGWIVLGSIVAVAVLAAVGIAVATSAKSNLHRTVAVATSSARRALETRTVKPISQDRVHASYAALPLAFEANEGQADPQVKYVARGNGYTLFLTSGDAVLSLASHSASSISRPKEAIEHRIPGYSLKTRKLIRRQLLRSRAKPTSVATLRFHMLNGSDQAPIAGEGLMPSRVNYFIANDPRKWHQGISRICSRILQRCLSGCEPGLSRARGPIGIRLHGRAGCESKPHCH